MGLKEKLGKSPAAFNYKLIIRLPYAAFKLQMEWAKHSYFKKNYSFSAALKYRCSCILNGDDGKTLSFNSVIRLEEKKVSKDGRGKTRKEGSENICSLLPTIGKHLKKVNFCLNFVFGKKPIKILWNELECRRHSHFHSQSRIPNPIPTRLALIHFAVSSLSYLCHLCHPWKIVFLHFPRPFSVADYTDLRKVRCRRAGKYIYIYV